MVQQATFGTTWTLSPTMVADATYGISWMNQEVTGADFELGNYGTDVLGIPGTNGGSFGRNDPRYAGMPHFEGFPLGSGFSPLGNNDNWAPAFREEKTYALAGNLTKLHGSHQFRFGFSVNRLRLDHWQPELGAGPRGRFDFNGNVTNLRGGTQAANIYNQYAALLLGLPNQVQQAIQYEVMTGREWQHGIYAQDRWQLNNKTTLNLGLRYELYPLMQREGRGIETIDLDTFDVLLGGVGGNPTDLNIKTSKTLFAPRVGLVYRINDQTVFRTGYGLTYNPLPFSRPLRGFYPLTINGELRRALRLPGGLHAGAGHSGGRRPRPEQRSGPAAEQLRYALPGKTTSRVATSTRGTSPSSGACLGISRSTRHTWAQQAGTGSPTSTSTPLTRRAAARPAGPSSPREAARSRSTAGDPAPRRITTRCRWRSTGRSRTGS